FAGQAVPTKRPTGQPRSYGLLRAVVAVLAFTGSCTSQVIAFTTSKNGCRSGSSASSATRSPGQYTFDQHQRQRAPGATCSKAWIQRLPASTLSSQSRRASCTASDRVSAAASAQPFDVD